MTAPGTTGRLTGIARCGKRTKDLIRRLRRGDIAVIDHADLDPVAARGLVDARVAAVVNVAASSTGRYPNEGPRLLLENHVPLIDGCGDAAWELIRDGQRVTIDLEEGAVIVNGGAWVTGKVLSADDVQRALESGRENLRSELRAFVENTLAYVSREQHVLSESLPLPDLRVNIRDRHALVVVRGAHFEEDLTAIIPYIRERRPVIIAVDGAADALLQRRLKPHIILGDMDSVSDQALRCGADIIVHAFPNQEAPGLARLQRLGIDTHLIPAIGTSEDVALLLAYEAGASVIVAVGAHSSITDFFDKGRSGMASTFLTRLKVGQILVDAKGVSQLYTSQRWALYLAPLLLLGVLLAFTIVVASPAVQNVIELLRLELLLRR